MKMKAKVLNFNQLDDVGDIFVKGQITFHNPVKVIKGFDHTKLMFEVEVSEHEDGLYAEFPEMESIKGLYPAIGFGINNQDDECVLFAIGLCESVNLDPTILPL